jgi:phytoene dehydrogenase-like protein
VKPIADIAVVGAGAAGIAAAISATRAGAKTLLLDARSSPGGTGGFSGLTTLCGLYDDEGNFLNGGFTREFAEALAERRSPPRLDFNSPQQAGPEAGAPIKMGRVWVLPYRPERFRTVAEQLISATPNLQVQWNCPLTEVRIEAGRIVSLNDCGRGGD